MTPTSSSTQSLRRLASKRTTAIELLRAQDLAISTQVLGDFYVQATRSTRTDRLTHSQASRLIESFTRNPF